MKLIANTLKALSLFTCEIITPLGQQVQRSDSFEWQDQFRKNKIQTIHIFKNKIKRELKQRINWQNK